MPAGSKTDPSLAKAKPISNGGSASVVTYLRRRATKCSRIEEQEYLRETTLKTPKSVKKVVVGGGAPDTKAEIPLQPMVKTMVRQDVPLQPMEVRGGADIHLQPMEDHMPDQVDA